MRHSGSVRLGARVAPGHFAQTHFLVFGADGGVYESAEPVWDEGRVGRSR
ncbi:hypothetical protein [Microbispora sp. NPDC046933]